MATDSRPMNPQASSTNPLAIGNGLGPQFGPQKSPVAGMPDSPGYIQTYNPQTMGLMPGFQQQMAQNSQGYNQYAQEAMRKGPSAWANLANTQQDVQQGQQASQLAAKNAGATAQTEANLASSGGLSSGARERAAEGGQHNLTEANQNLASGNIANKMQIGMNDEQNRMQQLGALPGMEQARTNAYLNVAGQDIGHQIGENQSQNAYLQNLFNVNSTASAANQQANAMQAAADQASRTGLLGQSGGIMGSGIGAQGALGMLNPLGGGVGKLFGGIGGGISLPSFGGGGGLF